MVWRRKDRLTIGAESLRGLVPPCGKWRLAFAANSAIVALIGEGIAAFDTEHVRGL